MTFDSISVIMARSRSMRLISLVLSNILLPIAVLIFATGFFPYKPVLPGLATFKDVRGTTIPGAQEPQAVFDRVIFMVVDALRSDFVYGYNSGFEFTQR
jgi:ethanolaminephosphotransferase